MNNYDDIINLKHYEPKYHKRMSMDARAAQFSPFAALTGYGDVIKESARVVDRRYELDEDLVEKINNNLNVIIKSICNKPMVKVLYFLSDKYKCGGKYLSYIGCVRRVDTVIGEIIFIDGFRINFRNIMDIDVLK